MHAIRDQNLYKMRPRLREDPEGLGHGGVSGEATDEARRQNRPQPGRSVCTCLCAEKTIQGRTEQSACAKALRSEGVIGLQPGTGARGGMRRRLRGLQDQGP